jgi:hypothetical protein
MQLGRFTSCLLWDRSNARTEYLSFDGVEMYYPYNGIHGRGFINKFEATIHQAYLCVIILAT